MILRCRRGSLRCRLAGVLVLLWALFMVSSDAVAGDPPRQEVRHSSRELLFMFGWGTRSATSKSDRELAAPPLNVSFVLPSCSDCLDLSRFLFDDLWEAYPHKPSEVAFLLHSLSLFIPA